MLFPQCANLIRARVIRRARRYLERRGTNSRYVHTRGYEVG